MNTKSRNRTKIEVELLGDIDVLQGSGRRLL